MGCACLGGSQVEQFLTDFIDELKIRDYKDKIFVGFIEKNNPFIQKGNRLDSLTTANPMYKSNNISEHTKYSADLLGFSREYLCLALLFLTHSDYKSLSGQYLILVDRLKNQFLEVNGKKLADFYKSDYEILRSALIFYCRVISYDVVNACGLNRLTNDQANQLRSIYGSNVIEAYVNELMKDCRVETVNHEEFFQKNFQNIQHQYVRERLRTIYTTRFAPVPSTKQGKIYTLNSNVENDRPKVQPQVQAPSTVNIPTDPILSMRAPIYRKSTTSSEIGNPMNVPVYIPSQPQNILRTYDLTNSGNDLVSAPSNRVIQEISSSQPYVSLNPANPQYVNQTRYDADWLDNSGQALNYNYPTVRNAPNLNLDQYSLLEPPKKLNNRAYIDPYNNPTNKFLYGIEKIDASNVQNLPTKLFMSLKQFRKTSLDFHNETRSLHQAPQLVEDPSLTERAQDWANKIAESDSIEHSNLLWNDKSVGENIAKGSAILEDPAKLVCSKWYSEISNYNFSTPGTQTNTKNFTQMIWKNTRQVGFGLAYSKTGNTYVVVNYFPAGNDESRISENVSPAYGSN